MSAGFHRPYGGRYLPIEGTPRPSSEGLPLRVGLHEISDAELEEWNRRSSRDGGPIWESVEEELEMIERVRRRQQRAGADAARWASHPDERVRVAFARSGSLVGDARGLRKVMIVEEMEAARAEGMLWTPLLEALEAVGPWPLEQSHHLPIGGVTHSLFLPDVERHLSRLREHLRPELEDGELERLLEFRSPSLRRVAARHLPRLTPALREALFAEASCWPSLARNPRLEGELLALLGRRAAQVLRREGEGAYEEALATLEGLSRQGIPLGVEEAGALRELLRRVLQQRPFPLEPGLGFTERAHRLLLHKGAWTEEEAQVVWGYARRTYQASRGDEESQALLRAVIASPTASDPVWRQALEDFSEGEVHRWVAECERARSSPATRARLRESPEPEVLERLAGDAQEDLGAVLAGLARLDAGRTIGLLQAMNPEQTARLTPSDLAPLLASQTAALRLAAIRVSGGLGGRSAASLGTPRR